MQNSDESRYRQYLYIVGKYKMRKSFGNRNKSVLLMSFSFLFQCEYKYIFVISRQCMGIVFKLHHVSKIKTFCYFGYIFYGESWLYTRRRVPVDLHVLRLVEVHLYIGSKCTDLIYTYH
jgi:hypothetical protein